MADSSVRESQIKKPIIIFNRLRLATVLDSIGWMEMQLPRIMLVEVTSTSVQDFTGVECHLRRGCYRPLNSFNTSNTRASYRSLELRLESRSPVMRRGTESCKFSFRFLHM